MVNDCSQTLQNVDQEPKLEEEKSTADNKDGFKFGFDDANFQDSLKQVLNNEGNQEESLKGMEAMLKGLQSVMEQVGGLPDGEDGEDDDFS